MRREKVSIAEGLVNDGTFVAPDILDVADTRAARVLRFGETDRADVQLLTLDATRVHARYRVDKHVIDARVPGGGKHRALSVAAVMACIVAIGEDPTRASALSDARSCSFLAAFSRVLEPPPHLPEAASVSISIDENVVATF